MFIMEPTARNRLFSVVADTLRKLPSFRGKLRAAEQLYRALNPSGSPFHVKSPLYKYSLIFNLNLNCAHERTALLMNGYEADTIHFLSSIYSGGSILDVGANVGLISLPLAKNINFRSPGDRIFAVEAMPVNYERLCENIRENALTETIVPLNFALGDRDFAKLHIQIEGDDFSETGTANILADERLGPSKFHPGGWRMSGQKKMEITSRTLDSAINEGLIGSNISLIKIDADGYDFNVLKGASALLTTIRPVIFSEMAAFALNWHDQKIAEVVEFCRGYEYEFWAKEPKRFLFTDQFEPENFTHDVLLVPREKRSHYVRWMAA